MTLLALLRNTPSLLLAFGLAICTSAAAEPGNYYEVTYAPSQAPGELKLGVTYTLWVPPVSKPLRGVIVHQHGCGAGACQGGTTAAYDLHWQALASKWNCALLGPSYRQSDQDDCRLWSDPRNGSDQVFLRALTDLAALSGHPELNQAPWCLWGHSGGGFWASEMEFMHPERVIAVWLRSGASGLFRKPGDTADRGIPPAVLSVPVMCNPGIKEKDDPRFGRIWDGMLELFKTLRQKGAPIGFAPDPRTGHECGDSRYLAIPFFDACLALRLPPPESADQGLRPVDFTSAWWAPLTGDQPEPDASFSGPKDQAVWLPNEAVAKAWSHYVRTGSVSDASAPPAPCDFLCHGTADGSVVLTWDAVADFESGLAGFMIYRDGQEIGRLPEKSTGRFGRPLFQPLSYHDTPEKPLPQMRFVDTNSAVSTHRYQIVALNGAGLQSAPAAAVLDVTPGRVEAATKSRPIRVLIAYHSRTGNTEKMAQAAADGAKRAENVVTVIKRISEVSKKDLEEADGLVLGCPTYFGNLPGEAKVILDDWNWKWKVDFTDKAGGAFATAGGQVGGQEHVVVSLLLFMLHNRMVVAGPLYRNEKTGSIWAEAGAAAVTGPLDPGVSEGELDGARRLGERVGRLAEKLRERPAN